MNVKEINDQDIAAYFEYNKEFVKKIRRIKSNNSHSYVNQALSDIKFLYKYVWFFVNMQRNIDEKIVFLKEAKRERIYTKDQCKRYLKGHVKK